MALSLSGSCAEKGNSVNKGFIVHARAEYHGTKAYYVIKIVWLKEDIEKLTQHEIRFDWRFNVKLIAI